MTDGPMQGDKPASFAQSESGGSPPPSPYTSQIGDYALESLEVKNEKPGVVVGAGEAGQSGAQPQGDISFTRTRDLLRAGSFSRRKALVVSSVVTILAVGISAGALLLFSHHKPAPTSTASQIPTQEVKLNSSESTALPAILQDNSASLLVNGNLIAKGQLKLSVGSYSAAVKPASLSDNRTFSLPDQSGTICLDSNNCGYATQAALTAVRARIPLNGTGVSSLNGHLGALNLQGTVNQVVVGGAGNTLTLGLPQDIAVSSSPTFSSLTLNNNFKVSGNVQTSKDCTVNLHGGKLTTDASGNIICGDDFATPGGGVDSLNGLTGTLTLNGTANQINVAASGTTLTLTTPQNIAVSSSPTFTGLTLSGLANGVVKVSGGVLSSGTVALGSEVSGVLPVANGGTGVNGSTAANGQLLIGNGSGFSLATLTQGSGIAVTNGAGSVTIAVDSTVCTTSGNCTAAGSAGGDLTGTYPNPTIAKLQGTTVSISSLAGGQFLMYNGTNWLNQGLSGDVTVASNGAATIAAGAVTTGKIADGNVTNVKLANSSLTVTAGTGLSGGGSVSLGGSTTLSVSYGAVAGTAVQGNTSLTCSSGAGNLSGGGNSITLGSGGSCNNLSIVNNPTFTTSVTTPLLNLTGAGSTGTLQVANLGQATTYTLPDPGTTTATVCLDTGNCAGTGGGITGTGTSGQLAKFTSGGTIGDSIVSESGTAATVAGQLVVNAATGFVGNLVDLQLNAVSQFSVTEAGAVTSAGGLTVSAGGASITGSVTLGSLNTAGVVHTNGSGTLSTGAVSLGSETTGDYVANLGSLTGLSTSGNSGAGSTPTLSVLYGSTASTAVQGNTTFTCASGTGNLTGGGTTITEGAGGTCGSLNTNNAVTFTTSVTTPLLQSTGALAITPGGALTVGATNQTLLLQGSTTTITAQSNTHTITVSFAGTATGNVTYNFDNSASAGTYTVCTTAGNCVGTGGAVSGSGTNNQLVKFTSTGSTVGDSQISDDGTTVTITGNAVIQGTDALTLGTAGPSGNDGAIVFNNATNGNTLTLRSGATGSALTFTLPTADGSGGQCLSTDGSGVLSFTTCLSGGGGGSGGVTSLNGLSGVLSVANATGSGSTITIQDASTTQKGIAQFNSTNFTASSGTINTIQNIAATSAPTFASLTLNGSLAVTTGGANITGTVTLGSLNSAGVVHTDALGVLSTSAVALGTDTTGSYVASLGTLTGLSTTGNGGAGSTPTLSVQYGSAANTAVQGNTTFTCASGTGNLAGGGTTITEGAGGSCGTIDTNNAVTFSTSVTTPLLQSTTGLTITPGGALVVGSTTDTFTLQGDASSIIAATSGANVTTVGFVTPTASQSINFPDESGTICLQSSTACGFALGTTASYIQNQNAAQQASSNFWISGTGQADTAFLAPSFDTASATALDIGTTNATNINLNQNTTVAAGKNLTVDTDTLYIDGTNHAVGIGTTTPGEKLEVVGNIVSKGTSWTSRTSAADNQWTSVTYGNGLFVAVAQTGTGNRVMTSPDGINWTARTSAADNQWISVTYGNGLFVATSKDNAGHQVMTSPDGINWTLRATPGSNSFLSVTYGNGLFVAIGQFGDTFITSPDGVTWTAVTGPSSGGNQWSAVTYGNGLFVAVAINSVVSGQDIMTSPDGVTWTLSSGVPDMSWTSLTYGNGLFVAVSQDSSGDTVMTSPDGITWTLRTSPIHVWTSVTYGNGLFIAVGAAGAGNRVMTSPDGINWTSRTSAADNIWLTVTYGNGVFVAASLDGTGNRVMTSGKTDYISVSDNNIYQGGISVLSGDALFRPAANSGTAFRIQNVAGVEVLSVDTSTNAVKLGKASTLTGLASFFNASGSGSISLQAANPGSTNYTLTLPAETGTLCSTAAVCTGYQSSLTFNNGLTNTSGTVQLGGSLVQNTTLAAGNANSLTLTSDLSGGARSTDVLTISQPNNATNDSTGSLLVLDNQDSASSSAAVLKVNTGGNANGVTINAGSGSNAFAINNVTNGDEIRLNSSIAGGNAIDIDNQGTVTSGHSLLIKGSGSSAGLAAFTGSYILANPTRIYSGASTVTDTGNFLNLARSNTISNASGTFAIQGDLATLSSNCTQTSGTCTDSSHILTLNQQYASATGSVLNVLGAGTGNLVTLDTSNASANGVSIDVQSSSSSQYALKVTSNNGLTNDLYVRADGNVGIGTATPTSLLHIVGTQPAAVSGAGTVATGALAITGGKGGNTNGGTATAGAGAAISLTSGAGGDAVSGSTNGNGGNGGTITIQGGAGGAAIGSGTAGSYGNIVLQSSGGNVGINTASPSSKLTINTPGTADATAQLFIDTAADSNRGIVIQQNSNSQTGALIHFQNSAGTGIAAIDASGKYLAPNGTAAAPSLSFFNSSTTGIYRPAVDQLGITTAGTERLRVDNNGNVGIGVTGPQTTLDVLGSARLGSAPSTATTVTDNPLSSGATTVNVVSTTNYPSAGTIRIDDETMTYTGVTSTSFTGVTRAAYNTTAASHSSGASVYAYLLAVGSGQTATPRLSVIQSDSSTAPAFAIQKSDGTAAFTVNTNSLRVGIGVPMNTGPGAKLQINTSAAATAGLLVKAAASQTAQLFQLTDSSNDILAELTPQGAANQRQQFNLYNTLEATPTNYERLAQYADNTNNIFRIEAQNGGTGTLRNLVLQGGGGNVGIGTTGPTSLLHIVGTQPAAVSGAGTVATGALAITGGKGGNTNGGTATAGAGAAISLTSGAGGDAVSGSTNGNGGNGGTITIQGGAGGAAIGSGTAGSYGNLLLQASGGRVGIGNAPSPAATLNIIANDTTAPTVIIKAASGQGTDILQAQDSSGNTAFQVNSNGSVFVSGNVTSTVNTSATRFGLTGTYTYNPSSGAGTQLNGFQNQLQINPGTLDCSSSCQIYGLINIPKIASSSTNISTVIGAASRVDTIAGYTGTITNGYGFQALSPSIAGSNLISNYIGFRSDMPGTGSNSGNTSGTLQNFGVQVVGGAAAAGAGGTLNNYGVSIFIPNGDGTAGTTNNYGLRITGNSSAGDTNYAIYSDSTTNSYLAGSLGINTTTPRRKMDILDTANPQLRLTYTDNSVYTDLQTTSAGYLQLKPSGDRLIVGTGDTGTTTPTILVLDNKTDSGDPTGVEGAMYYSAASKSFRCYRDGAWSNCATFEIDHGYEVQEDFMGGGTNATSSGIGENNWNSAAIGAAGTITYNDANMSADRPGILHIATTATANQGEIIRLQQAGSQEPVTLAAGIDVKMAVTVGTTVTNQVTRVGLHNATNTSDPTGGVWWEAAPSTNANWQYCYYDGSVKQCTATAVAVAANTFVRLEIRVTALGSGTSAVTYYLNGTAYSVTSATVSTTNHVSPIFLTYTTTTSTRDLYVDYFQLRGTTSAAR